jgi:quercetin 2,3-dioxygenase
MNNTATMTLRRAHERGHADHGWLNSFHTFSFAGYHDPRHMGFRALRVINDDTVAAGQGFPMHPHRDMEILSYVLEGALQHKDSMGNGSVITPGEVQRLTAGRGMLHSEFNPSRQDPVHFLQIWLVPDQDGLTPSYEQKRFTPAQRQGRLQVVASPDGREGSVTLHADASLHATLLGPGERAALQLAPERYAYLHLARGELELNGQRLGPGDAAAFGPGARLELKGLRDAEALVFDLA